MMFAVIFFVALGFAGAEECNRQDIEKCGERLMDLLNGDPNEEELCQEMQSSYTCVQNKVKNCLGDDVDEEIKDQLKNLGNYLAKECSGEGAVDAKECDKKDLEKCVENLVSVLIDDSNEARICQELRPSVTCLQDKAKECLGDEIDEEVQDGLKNLDNLLTEHCSGDVEVAETEDGKEEEGIEKCFIENDSYLSECILEGVTKALDILVSQKNMDENTLKCLNYGLMAECFVERTIEKCGEEAGQLAKEEFEDMPPVIRDACLASRPIETTIELLDKEKEKENTK